MSFPNATDSPDWTRGPSFGSGVLLDGTFPVLAGHGSTLDFAYVGNANDLLVQYTVDVPGSALVVLSWLDSQAIAGPQIRQTTWQTTRARQTIDVVRSAGPTMEVDFQNLSAVNMNLSILVMAMQDGRGTLADQNVGNLAQIANANVTNVAPVTVNPDQYVPGKAYVSYWATGPGVVANILTTAGSFAPMVVWSRMTTADQLSFADVIALPRADWTALLTNTTGTPQAVDFYVGTLR